MKTHESSQFYFTYEINRYEKTKFVISFDIKNILFHEKKEKIHSSVRTNDRRKHLRITVNRRDEAIAAPLRIVVAPEILQFFLAESRQIFRSRLVPRSDPFLSGRKILNRSTKRLERNECAHASVSYVRTRVKSLPWRFSRVMHRVAIPFSTRGLLIAMEREIDEGPIRGGQGLSGFFVECILNGLNENRKGKPHSIRTMIIVNAARTNKAPYPLPLPSPEDYSIIPVRERDLTRWFFPVSISTR